jgi:hypothetical protein
MAEQLAGAFSPGERRPGYGAVAASRAAVELVAARSKRLLLLASLSAHEQLHRTVSILQHIERLDRYERRAFSRRNIILRRVV